MRCRTLLVIGSLVAAVPGAPLSAGQRTEEPPLPADGQQTQETQPPAADDARETEPDADGNQRKAIREWFRERAEATQGTTPEEAGGGFSLTVGTVISGSGLAVGARYRLVNALPRGLDAQVSGMVSLRGYQEYGAAVGWLDRDRSTVALDVADEAVALLFDASSPKTPGSSAYLDVRHRIYTRQHYFGSGIDTPEGDQADYTLSGTSIDGVWQKQFSRTLGLSVRGGWLNLQVGRGHDDAFIDVEDRFAPAARPGWSQQPGFVTFGAGLVSDGRDNPQAPERGWFVGSSLRRFVAVSEADLTFTRATMDVRTYERLPGGVVALRALASADLAPAGASTPFYLQTSLGGPLTLRGFHNYRFSDRAMVHASVEYRWRVHRWIEVAPFVDAGTVASALTRLSGSSIEVTPGVGLRGRTARRVLGRLDWSRSREGQRLVLGVGPAF